MNRRLLLPLALLFSVGHTVVGQAGGLDRAEAIGPYLDGALPSETPKSASGSWKLNNAFPNALVFDPLQMVPVPGTNQLVIIEKAGGVVAIKNDSESTTRTVLLDITSQVQSQGDSGLLGCALHPEFGQEGSPNKEFVYLYYRYTPDTSEVNKAYCRLSRFNWAGGSNPIDPSSEYVLINQYDRHNWHNGGGLAFGPDGFLYLSIGEEGGANDEFNSTQRKDLGLFSGVFRIDVDQDPSRSHPVRRQPRSEKPPPAGWPDTYSQGYYIPKDNPWQSPDGSELEEFWAVGTRSPHRMTIDPVTGQVWLGDVGQASREEINLVVKGANLQWPYQEGDIGGPKPKPTNLIGTDQPPLLAYNRQIGGCVTGGYVYRGTEHPELYGKYLFGDFNNGKIYSLESPPGESPIIEELTDVEDGRLGSFGIDANGEVYALLLGNSATDGGTVFRFSRTGTAVPEPPATLSATGAFTDLASLTPRSGVMPYDLIQPLWSDGAEKKRWLSIPNDGTPDSPDEKIQFSETEPWTFPAGSVLIKHFEISGRRLETRFLVKGSDGKFFGFTYKWRPDNSDADLLPGPSVEETIDLGNNEQILWHFPSRTECFTCHTDAAQSVLGPKTRHLNRDLFYPSTGRTANQLVTLNDLGFFSPSLNPSDIPNFLTSANIYDTTESLDRRARAYIDINCSQCHRPNGPTQAQFDARFTVPPNFQNIVNIDATNPLTLTNPKLVEPGDVENSILHLRMNSLDGCCAMPPLAKNAVDTDAVNLVADWIRSLDPDNSPTGPTTDPAPADYSVPELTLTFATGNSTVTGTFDIAVAATESILGLTASDFDVVNGTVNSITGSGANWTATITPTATGAGSIDIASDKVIDLNGNANLALAAPLSFDAQLDAAPTNLLTNGDFENGIQSWDSGPALATASGSPRTGSGATLVDSTSFIVQSISTTPLENFVYTGWYTAEASLSELYAGVTFFDANGTEVGDTFATLLPTATYQSFRVDVTAPAGASVAAVYILTATGGTATIDDLSFYVSNGNPPDPTPTNLFSNGGFETGTFSGWDMGPTNMTITGDAHSGSYAANFDVASFIVHNQAAAGSDLYTFTGYYKSAVPGGIHEAGIIFWGTDGTLLDETDTSFAYSISFSPFEVSGTAPAGTASISVWMYNGTGSTLIADDLLLELNSGSTLQNAAPKILTSKSQAASDPVTIAAQNTRNILSNRDPSAFTDPDKNPVQPDLAVANRSSDWMGFDIYNRNGTGQTVSSRTRRKRIQDKFDVTWQNDAIARYDSGRMQGTPSDRNFILKYFVLGLQRKNCTALFTTGRYESERTPPDAATYYQIKVRQKGRSRSSVFRGRLTTQSLLDTAKVDAVQFKTRRRK